MHYDQPAKGDSTKENQAGKVAWMSENKRVRLRKDWKAAAYGPLGTGAVTVAEVGSFPWWAGIALIAAGLFWLVSTLTVENRAWWHTYKKLGVLVGLCLTGGLAAFVSWQIAGQRPTVDDISVAFVPDHINSFGMNGRVVVRSKAKLPLSIDEIRITSPYSSSSNATNIQVRATQPASFPFQAYRWRGSTVTFEANYSVEGTKGDKGIWAEFYVPSEPSLSREIEPSGCCSRRKTDIATAAASDAALVANGEQGCLPIEPTERRSDGAISRVRNGYERRVFTFDPVDGVAGMQSFMRGSWHELKVPIGRTIDGRHVLRYCWHEANGYMAIEADNNYAILDVDTGLQRGKLND